MCKILQKIVLKSKKIAQLEKISTDGVCSVYIFFHLWDSVGECGKSVGRVWEECGKSVGRVCEECGKSVGKVWEECGKSVGRVWEECGESVGRVWGECGESVGRVWGLRIH